MTRRKHAFILLCLLNIPFLTTPSWAVENVYDGAWYLSAGAGRSFYQMDSDNFINPGPGWPDDHYYKNSIHDGSFVDVTAGYAWTRFTNWFPAFLLGLNYTYAFQGKVSGYVNQYNLNQFKNYSYSYDFSRQTLMAVFKADIYKSDYCLMPYFIVGTGASFNKGSNYEEEPLENVTPRISPGYGTGNHVSWSYIVGVGVDYMIRDDIWVALEYNYGDFGTVETGKGQGTPTVTGVNYSDVNLSNKVKANSIAINFTYLLNYV